MEKETLREQRPGKEQKPCYKKAEKPHHSLIYRKINIIEIRIRMLNKKELGEQ